MINQNEIVNAVYAQRDYFRDENVRLKLTINEQRRLVYKSLNDYELLLAEKQGLVAKIGSQEKEINYLQRFVDDNERLAREQTQLRDANQRSVNKLYNLNVKLEDSQGKCSALEAIKGELIKQNHLLQSEVNEGNKKMMNELEKLKRKVPKESGIEATKKNLRSISHDKENLMRRCSAKEDESRKLKLELATIQTKLCESQKNEELQKQQFGNLLLENEALAQKINSMKNTHENLLSKYSALKEKLSEQSVALQRQQEAAPELKRQLEERVTQVKSLSDSLLSIQKDKESCVEKIKELESIMSDLKNDSISLGIEKVRVTEELSKALENARLKNISQSKEMNILVGTNEQLQHSIEALNEYIRVNEQASVNYRHEMSSKMSQMEEELCETKIGRNQTDTDYERLKQAMRKLQQEIEKLKHRLKLVNAQLVLQDCKCLERDAKMIEILRDATFDEIKQDISEKEASKRLKLSPPNENTHSLATQCNHEH